jgi:hypothetical protein
MTKVTYSGSCHCGRIAFDLDATLDYVMECSRSLCWQMGALWHRDSDKNLRVTAGEEQLALYQFKTMTAKHHFCPYGGIFFYSPTTRSHSVKRQFSLPAWRRRLFDPFSQV